MDIHLNPDLQAKLARLAAQRGRDAETLAREAIERFVDYDEWFIEEVEKGFRRPPRKNSARPAATARGLRRSST